MLKNDGDQDWMPLADPAFRRDVIDGLSRLNKAIPARWFYDRRGSELFEEITQVPEYYPARTERSILSARISEIAQWVGPGRAVVEFGSGSSAKTPILLSGIAPAAYVPIDISGPFLRDAANALQARFPDLPVHPVVGDFTNPLHIPHAVMGHPLLGFFPGSTIGNLQPQAAVDLLRAMATTLGREALLLIGIDRTKEKSRLLAAYDDRQGVTARFNLNLLTRINRELGGTVPVEAFRHEARWNDRETRIEMHLVARHAVAFEVDKTRFEMAAGESIHSENSIKYSLHAASVLLRAGGWTPIADWTDEEQLFSVILAREGALAPAP